MCFSLNLLIQLASWIREVLASPRITALLIRRMKDRKIDTEIKIFLRRFLLLDLLANASFLFPELGSELRAKVLELENLANLDLSSAIEWSAFEPLHRFFHRSDLPQPEAGNEFL